MTMPSSGVISFADLQTEFGGSNPISINEYYGGGGYVPSGTINASNSQIPSSGQVSLGAFYGCKQVPSAFPVRVLIVGGGGGGHQRNGGDNNAQNGAGGAGGYVDATFDLPKGSYSFTIGGGGYNGNGGDTVAFGYTAYGGGMGGGSDSQAGSSGGSGGGAAERTGSYGSATQPSSTPGSFGNQPGYGNNGSGGPAGGGGGSGSGASGGYGGSGRQWINGTYYAAGGGSSFGYPGGTGGGGNGPGGNATNYGSGGGGAYGNGQGPQQGTYGYQGIVIVSYVWDYQVLSGGSVTSVSNGSGPGNTYRYYHTFTTNGSSITF